MGVSAEHDRLLVAEVERRMNVAAERIALASRFGQLVKWGIGLDPDARHGREWWARAEFLVPGHPSPTGQPWQITVEGFSNALDAADALADRLDDWWTARIRA